MAAAAPTPASIPLPAASPHVLRHPMLWAACSFAAGIGWAHSAGAHFWTPPNWQIAGAVLLLLLGLCVIKRSWFAGAAAPLSIAVLGIAQSNLGRSHPAAVLPQQLENQEVEIIGVVTRTSLPIEQSLHDPDSSGRRRESYQQIDETTACITNSSASSEAACNSNIGELGVRVGIYGADDGEFEDEQPSSPASSWREFHYGERVRIRGRIRAPQTYEDPGAFDYRAYLLDNGLAPP